MDTTQAIALKDKLTAAIAEVIEETGANPHEVQVRVTCVHDTGQLADVRRASPVGCCA